MQGPLYENDVIYYGELLELTTFLHTAHFPCNSILVFVRRYEIKFGVTNRKNKFILELITSISVI